MTDKEIIKMLKSDDIIPDHQLSMIEDWVNVRILMREEVTKNKSAYCPICNGKKTKYTRSLNKGMYFFLLHLSSKWNKGEWVHYDLVKREVSGKYQTNVTDYSKLTLFKLLEMKSEVDEDTGLKSGLCRITEAGWRFLRGSGTIPKHYYLVDNKVVKESTERVNFSHCQQKFKLKDLYND